MLLILVAAGLWLWMGSDESSPNQLDHPASQSADPPTVSALPDDPDPVVPARIVVQPLPEPPARVDPAFAAPGQPVVTIPYPRGPQAQRPFQPPQPMELPEQALAAEPLPLAFSPADGRIALLPEEIDSHTKTARRMALASDSLESVVKGRTRRLLVPAPDGTAIPIRVDRLLNRGGGTFSMIGEVEGEPQKSLAQLVWHDGILHGNIARFHLEQEIEYRILADGHLMVRELDQTSMRDVCGDPGPAPESADPGGAPPEGDPPPDMEGGSGEEAGDTPGFTTVDLVVGYDQSARVADGGHSQIEARIISSVDRMNLAFTNSLVTNTELMLLGVVEDPDYVFPGKTAGTMGGADELGDLENGAASNPSLNTVSDYATELGADLQAFVVRQADGSAGVAYRPGRSSITARDYMTATRITFVHELGHNFGAQHSWGDSSGDASKTVHRYGWRLAPAGQPRVRTIMAYDWAWGSGVRIPYFANPAVTYQGARTGQVDGYDATGDPLSDSRYVSGGLEGSHGAGFDGSNPALGARNGPYILTQAAGRANLRTRAAFQVVTPATGAMWDPGETREIYWRGGHHQDRVDVQLFKGGVLQAALDSSRPGHQRRLAWTLPAGLQPGTDYRIRVRRSSSSFADSGLFTIAGEGVTVTPAFGLESTGPVGGPFAPASLSYTLTNTGVVPLNWSAAADVPWVSLSPTSGSLNPDAGAAVMVSFNAAADSLPSGSQSGVVTITAGSLTVTRPVSLVVMGGPRIVLEEPEGEPMGLDAGVDFGQVPVQSRELKRLVIRNVGAAPLTLGNVNLNGGGFDFTVVRLPMSPVPVNGMAFLDISFRPNNVWLWQAVLSISSDDPDQPILQVPVTGRGVPLPGSVQLPGLIHSAPASLDPTQLISLGDVAVFSATSPLHGQELWVTDGTHSGTRLLLDIAPGPAGSGISNPTRLGSRALFSANNGVLGSELWGTDGTAQGTFLVRDVYLGATGSDPERMHAAGPVVYFSARDFFTGFELWRSDGTSTGTFLVSDINPGFDSSSPSDLVSIGSTLYFTALTDNHGRELWKSDGTAAGTVMVRDINPGTASSSISSLTVVGSTLFFAASNGVHGVELWRSDGTAAGTFMVRNINPGAGSSSWPAGLVEMEGALYFTAYTDNHGMELWRSNGTSDDTFMVRDIRMGWGNGVTGPLHVHQGRIYFAGSNGSDGFELWSSDGTASGTVMVSDIRTGAASSNPADFCSVDSDLYFTAQTEHGRELWKTDGTSAGTVMVRDILPGTGSSLPKSLTAHDGFLLFTADDGLHGRELWRSNGSVAGTRRVREDFAWMRSSDPSQLTAVGGRLFFSANNGTHGAELWRAGPGPAGVNLVQDINPGVPDSNPAHITPLPWRPESFVFSASTALGTELHLFDDSSGGTKRLADISPGSTSSAPQNFLATEDAVYFTAETSSQGRELWRTDGTDDGTMMVRDINPGLGSAAPSNLVRLGNVILFSAFDPAAGEEIWRSDGTESGTILLANINPGSAGSAPAMTAGAVLDDQVVFAATGPQGRELWVTDGTAIGTRLLRDINPGSGSSNPAHFARLGDRVVFSANGGTAVGAELWITDGTSEGTMLLADLVPGSSSSSPENLVVAGDVLYFAAFTPLHGRELWRTNGTEAGTWMVADLESGPGGSSPSQLTALNGRLFFTATTSQNGTELWSSDGTTEGTRLVVDMIPGAESSRPSNLTGVGNRLYFTARHPRWASQLFSLDTAAPGRIAVLDDSGQRLTAQLSGVDVGSEVAGLSITRPLVIRNEGWQDLSISSVTIAGAHAGRFSVSAPAVNPVPPGGSSSVQITFSPNAVQPFEALLQISSSDPLEAQFPVKLSGIGKPPPIISLEHPLGVPLAPGSGVVSFGSVLLNSPIETRVITIRNTGPGSILHVAGCQLSGEHVEDFKVFAGFPALLGEGGEMTLTIQFHAHDSGLRQARLTFFCNDPERQQFEVNLAADALVAPGPQQAIVVREVAGRRPGGGPFHLPAFSTSGLPLTIEVLAGPVSVDEAGQLTPTGATGAVTLRLSQPGSPGYDAATPRIVTFTLADWPRFTRVFSGPASFITAALTDEGDLWTWGYSPTPGMLGDATPTGRPNPAVLPSAVPWVNVALGANHSLGIKSDGTMWAWGANNGRLGDGSLTNRTSPVQIGSGMTWIGVGAGETHSAAVAADGSLWTWGTANTFGQLGLGHTDERLSPTRVGTANHWHAVACGQYFTVALTSGGEIWAFGHNGSGQLGLGNTSTSFVPVRLGLDSDWAALSAGNSHVAALKTNGTLWAWGSGSSGRLGLGTVNARLSPVQVGSDADWQKVACGSATTVAKKKDGTVWGWGANDHNQLGLGDAVNRLEPELLAAGQWADACTGRLQSVLLGPDGRLFAAGEAVGFSGAAPRALTRVTSPGSGWTGLSGNGTHFLAITEQGQVHGWGTNSGQFDTGTTLPVHGMLQIGIGQQWRSAVGGSHNFFSSTAHLIRQDGTLWAAGSNTNSTLGDGTTTTRTQLVQIGAEANWRQVAMGQNHGLAVREDGSLWGWGHNSNGQVGDGSTSNRESPVRVGTDNDWARVACGLNHSMALKTNGSLWAWGQNSSGQVGQGHNITPVIAPARVGSENDWTDIAAGSHSLALKADGSLWSWGSSSDGQLGLGDLASKNEPTRVGTHHHWARVFAGRNASIAITTDGRIFAAGNNSAGQLGNGDTKLRMEFTQIAEGGFVDAAIGPNAMAALHADGSLWTAGGPSFSAFEGGRNRGRLLHVLPGPFPQSILPPPANTLVWTPQATSGLLVQVIHISGPGHVEDGEIRHTGPEGSTASFMAWQPGDEIAWNAAPPTVIQLVRSHGLIQVWDGPAGGGAPLASGDRAVDFGAAHHQTAPWRVFTIVNTGSAPLTLNEVTVAGDWEVNTSAMAATLAPGESTTFQARFVAASEGALNGELRILSDDPDSGLFVVPVIGYGVALPPTGHPRILVQPEHRILHTGEVLRLSVTAFSNPAPRFQWRRNGRNIPGANGPMLAISDVSLARAGAYTVVVTSRSSVTSESAQVTVVPLEPREVLVAVPRPVTLDSGATGAVTSCVWMREEGAMPPASRLSTSPDGGRLMLQSTVTGDAGRYRCAVTGPGGTLETGPIDLYTLIGPPLLVEPAGLMAGIVGGSYQEQIKVAADHMRRPARFVVRGLPPGLRVDAATGVISGVPSRARTYPLSIAVSNLAGTSTARAELVINPLPSGLQGAWTGLVARDPALNQNLGGALDLRISPNAAVSGAMQSGATRLRLRGVLAIDPEGAVAPRLTLEIPRPGRPAPPPVSLDLAFFSHSSTLTGTAGITGSSSPAAEVQGWALNWHARSNPATARAGYHTLALKMGGEHEGDLAVPQGSGFGSFRATPGGSLRLGGRLADGASLTHASALGPAGQIRVFALLYGRPVPGSLWGRIDQDPGDDPVSPADNRLTGALSWSRPNRLPSGGLVYPGGFEPVTLNVEGGAYAPTPFLLGAPGPGGGIGLSFSGANLAESDTTLQQVSLFIDVKNRLHALPHPADVSIRSTASTGLFDGRFSLTDPHWQNPPPATWTRRAAYRGILVPEPDGTQRGHGHFLLPQLPESDPRQDPPPTLSGRVLLER